MIILFSMYLNKLLNVLEVVVKSGTGLTVTNISEITNIPRPSCYKLINDLQKNDLLYFQADMNFRIGRFEKAIELAKQVLKMNNKNVKSELSKINKIFKKKNSFKGKIGIFDIKDNKINHRLNFYKIEDKKLILKNISFIIPKKKPSIAGLTKPPSSKITKLYSKKDFNIARKAISEMQKTGAGFGGFATYLDLDYDAPDMFATSIPALQGGTCDSEAGSNPVKCLLTGPSSTGAAGHSCTRTVSRTPNF